IIRCMHTKQSEHLQGINLLTRGNPDRAGFTRPTLGSVVSAALGQVDTKIPNYVLLDPNPEGNEFKEYKASDLSGWLGPEHAPIRLGGSYTQLGRAADALGDDREARLALRSFFAKRYENERQSRTAAAQNAAFEKLNGLMDHTLVVAMGEFGRTPWLNAARGRDHYPQAWSLMLTGGRLKRGVVVGGTDPDGVDPDGRAFNEQNLFATIFTALGIDPYAE